jgi:putative pyruvate formate lyase activating enzyme
MWRMLRPDSAAVLEDELVRKSLKRYFAVMKGELPARFLVAKRAPAKIELDSNDKQLWRAHTNALKAYRKLLGKIDRGETKIEEVEIASPSLLDLKVELARRVLKSCHFCERRCGADRTAGEKGTCGVGEQSRVASEFMHYGEEPELVPSYTIFFSGCTFKCQFCQNWDISQFPDDGVETSPKTLASLASTHRREGARNVNWVGGDPTPNLHNILAALNGCDESVASVWNSNMYLSMEAMKLLFGTQDVYLTDLKYGNGDCALKYSKVPKYWEVVPQNHRLAFVDAELIIRHLVLPGHVECCTRPALEWIVNNLGTGVRVNIMGQYRPCGRVSERPSEYPELNRSPTEEEMDRAFQIADELDLKNLAH